MSGSGIPGLHSGEDVKAAEHPGTSEQLALLHSAAAPRLATKSAQPLAAREPVARVVLDVPLAHLDRPFEYAVPERIDADCVPGVRVRVRFAGRDTAGFVISRADTAEHDGKLTPIRSLVSPEPVLTPALATLARAVADRYAGTLHDVLRLAIPPRHARAEKALDAAYEAGRFDAAADHTLLPDVDSTGKPWQRYPAGPAFLRRLRDGQGPAACWLAAPTIDPQLDWPAALAGAAAATLGGGRGALLVVPDHRDVDRVAAALQDQIGADAFVTLTADQGPQARYTAWLKVLRGYVRCAVGTRSAAFAPVTDLGLVAWWDDGDDLLSEPRTPYPHVREVLRIRARQEQSGLLVGGFSRSVPVQRWLEEGLLAAVTAQRDRNTQPRVQIAGDERELARSGPAAMARIPSSAWRAARDGLGSGPVLVQVPRRGYLRTLRCQDCRAVARCAACHGPLQQERPETAPTCRWCGNAVAPFVCAGCGGHRLRAGTIGARRTAEELGRGFGGVPVIRSSAGEVVAQVSGAPALVIATPGAEPVADGGYAATLLLDAWALLDRPALDAGHEALRRWLAAAALTRPGAPVVLCSAATEAPIPAVEALVRWAPDWFAERDLAERRELSLPPAALMAMLTGAEGDVADLSRQIPETIERIGPLPTGDDTSVRLLLRVPWERGARLTADLQEARARRSVHKTPGTVQVRVDPEAGLL